MNWLFFYIYNVHCGFSELLFKILLDLSNKPKEGLYYVCLFHVSRYLIIRKFMENYQVLKKTVLDSFFLFLIKRGLKFCTEIQIDDTGIPLFKRCIKFAAKLKLIRKFVVINPDIKSYKGLLRKVLCKKWRYISKISEALMTRFSDKSLLRNMSKTRSFCLNEGNHHLLRYFPKLKSLLINDNTGFSPCSQYRGFKNL